MTVIVTSDQFISPDEPAEFDVPIDVRELCRKLIGPSVIQLTGLTVPAEYRWATLPQGAVDHIRGYLLGPERAADPSERLAPSIELGRDRYFFRFDTDVAGIDRFAVCPGALFEDPIALGWTAASVRWVADVESATGLIVWQAFESPEFM